MNPTGARGQLESPASSAPIPKSLIQAAIAGLCAHHSSSKFSRLRRRISPTVAVSQSQMRYRLPLAGNSDVIFEPHRLGLGTSPVDVGVPKSRAAFLLGCRSRHGRAVSPLKVAHWSMTGSPARTAMAWTRSSPESAKLVPRRVQSTCGQGGVCAIMGLMRLLVLVAAVALLGTYLQATMAPTGAPQRHLVMAPAEQSAPPAPAPQEQPAPARRPAALPPQSPLQPATAPASPASALPLPGSCSAGGRPPRACPPG